MQSTFSLQAYNELTARKTPFWVSSQELDEQKYITLMFAWCVYG